MTDNTGTLLRLISMVEDLSNRVSDLEAANAILQDQITARDNVLADHLTDTLAPWMVEQMQQAVIDECRRRPQVTNADGSLDHSEEIFDRLTKLERRTKASENDITSLFEFKGQHLLDHETNGGDPRELSSNELSSRIARMQAVSKR